MKNIRISACVITKNEERNISRWLHSMKLIADEIIVVDTGSDDKTVEIAQTGGAKIYHFKWIDDFAAAKNFAIERAAGDWIIFLDADEYFADDDCTKVRQWIIDHDVQADVELATLRRVELNEDKDDGNGEEYIGDGYYNRIFRNRKYLRYVGRIHEVLEHIGGKTRDFLVEGVAFYHTGYSSSIVAEKAARNLKILLAEAEKNGNAPTTAYFIADSYFVLERYDEAARYAKIAIDGRVSARHSDTHIHLVYLKSLKHLDRKDEFERALRVVREKFPDLPDFYIQGGMWLFKQRRYDEAERELRRGYEL